MLLSEFKNGLKPFGLKVIEDNGNYYRVMIMSNHKNKTIAVVDKNNIGIMNTYYAIEVFYQVEEIAKLISIIAKFASTAIEDRLPEEKVVLQLKEPLYTGVRLYLNSNGEVVFKDGMEEKSMIEWEDILSLTEVEIRDRYNVE